MCWFRMVSGVSYYIFRARAYLPNLVLVVRLQQVYVDRRVQEHEV